ncbi:MAG: ABC transporter substrate-binding protein [Streptosporangiales bacterium]|nr:ABC transporter substrate-binding protein [Streptosporangiales bacterium]
MVHRSPRRRLTTVLGVTLGLVAVLGAACGGGDGSGAPGGGGGTLKVGALYAMTGSGSFYGKVMSAGSELAAFEVNGSGGAQNYKFELMVEDHQSGDADVAVSASRKLIQVNSVPVILSSFTAPTVAVQSVAKTQGVLVFNGGGVGADLVGKENLYNTRMLGSQLMPALVQHASKEEGATRLATIFWNDAAGRSINKVTKDACGQAGCEVVAEEPHEIGATNFSAQLARIKARDPQMLVLGSYGNDVGYIVQQARRLGLNIPIIGNEWTPDAAKIAGDSLEGYTVIMDRFEPSSDDPEAKQFVAAYQKKNKDKPEFYAANYYDLVRYVVPDLIAMATKAGEDPTAKGVLVDQMAAAVKAKHQFKTVYGDAMVFSQDGTVNKPAAVFEVRDGELVRTLGFEDGQLTQAG